MARYVVRPHFGVSYFVYDSVDDCRVGYYSTRREARALAKKLNSN